MQLAYLISAAAAALVTLRGAKISERQASAHELMYRSLIRCSRCAAVYGKRSDAHRTRRGGGRLCNAMALLFIYARPLESGNWAEGAHYGKPTLEKSAPCVIYLQPVGVSRCINQ